MSTTMLAVAIVRKIAWTTPGRSGTPEMVTRASSLARAAPVTATPSRRASALIDDPGPGLVRERAADVDRHAVLLGELDRPGVHHPRPEAGQLEHLVVADPVDLAGLGDDAGVGRVDAVHVGVDLAGVGPEHRGQGHRRRVGAAPAERRDVVVLVDTLEPGDDHDLALAQSLGDPLGRDVPDPGLGVEAVGDDADLGTRSN